MLRTVNAPSRSDASAMGERIDAEDGGGDWVRVAAVVGMILEATRQ
jgi:hypothetical protein